jgi:hypothetical protein
MRAFMRPPPALLAGLPHGQPVGSENPSRFFTFSFPFLRSQKN